MSQDFLKKPTAKIRYSIFLSLKNNQQLKAIAAYKDEFLTRFEKRFTKKYENREEELRGEYLRKLEEVK